MIIRVFRKVGTSPNNAFDAEQPHHQWHPIWGYKKMRLISRLKAMSKIMNQ